jgi:hypothetical protein
VGTVRSRLNRARRRLRTSTDGADSGVADHPPRRATTPGTPAEDTETDAQ